MTRSIGLHEMRKKLPINCRTVMIFVVSGWIRKERFRGGSGWQSLWGKGPLRPDKPGIEAARNAGIGGAFDDRATIGEEGHLVGIAPESEDEVVVSHRAVRGEALIHFAKVDRPVALVDLHGVATAKCDVRASFAGEMDEVSLSAGAAARARCGSLNVGAFIRPYIERK